MVEDMFSRVRRLLAVALRIDPATVHPQSRLVADLGAKSIDVIEVILALEEEFTVDIPDFDITPAPFDLSPEMSVADLVALLERYH
jgi:acyl carrier protein